MKVYSTVYSVLPMRDHWNASWEKKRVASFKKEWYWMIS